MEEKRKGWDSMEDRQYTVIRDAVLARVMAAKTDAQGNLHNHMGWRLKIANAEWVNFPIGLVTIGIRNFLLGENSLNLKVHLTEL